jgi:hypothetical protein
MDNQSIAFRFPAGVESFLFAMYQVPLGLPANRYLGVLLGVKAVGHEAGNSSPTTAEVKNV